MHTHWGKENRETYKDHHEARYSFETLSTFGIHTSKGNCFCIQLRVEEARGHVPQFHGAYKVKSEVEKMKILVGNITIKHGTYFIVSVPLFPQLSTHDSEMYKDSNLPDIKKADSTHSIIQPLLLPHFDEKFYHVL